ncbi:MAG: hypothetical protein K2P57_12240, partial [Burkholderiales bacterium]|nr:hypothetical protein [Burkholderiales bacterium]
YGCNLYLLKNHEVKAWQKWASMYASGQGHLGSRGICPLPCLGNDVFLPLAAVSFALPRNAWRFLKTPYDEELWTSVQQVMWPHSPADQPKPNEFWMGSSMKGADNAHQER